MQRKKNIGSLRDVLAQAVNALATPECVTDESPTLVTIDEAARQIQASRSTIYRLIERGRLRKIQVLPGMPRIAMAEIRRLAAGGAR